MEVQHLSIIIASLALIISIWAKIEGSSNYQRQLRLERAKKVGDALISAQQLKNELSVCIEELNFTIEGLQNQPDTNNILPELRDTQADMVLKIRTRYLVNFVYHEPIPTPQTKVYRRI